MPAITFNLITPPPALAVSQLRFQARDPPQSTGLLFSPFVQKIWQQFMILCKEYDQIGGKLPVEVVVSSPNQCHQTHKEISHFWNKTSQQLQELSRVVQSHFLLLSVVVLNCHKCQHVHYDINDGMSCLWVNFRQAWLKEDVFSKDQRVSHSFSQGHCKWQGRLLSCSRKRSFGKKRFSFKP